jgi:DNA-binding transcriptional LysR family regulator
MVTFFCGWKNRSFRSKRTEKTMELYQLEYFMEAARQQNFTRAAQRLNLAQAALSEQIRKLEAELGTPLFNRGRRETTLTAAGETLRHHAEFLLIQASAARRAVRDLIQMKGGRLVIAAIPSVSACVLPAAISAFRKKHAEVELALLEGTSENVAQWVESGRADIGIVQLPSIKGPFVETLLFEEPFVILSAKTHPLATKRRVKLGDLADEPFVLYKGRARDAALAACREAGFEPRIACESSELETIRSLVAAHLGIALLPALATRTPSANCTVIRLTDDPVKRQVALLHRSDKTPSPSAEAFRKLLLGGGRH